MDNTAVWIALSQLADEERAAARSHRRKMEESCMNNALIERYIGCECILTLGTTGGSQKGTILSIRDNWVELQNKNSTRLVNLDYVSAVQPTKP